MWCEACGRQLPATSRARYCAECAPERLGRAAPPHRAHSDHDHDQPALSTSTGPGAVPWFPFANLRPHQDLLHRDALEAIEDGHFLLAEAPTGIGKTAAVLAAALSCTQGSGAAAGKTILFLTSRQTHHRIAIETLTALHRQGQVLACVDVIGKQAMCPRVEARLPRRAFVEFCATKTRNQSCEYLRTDPGTVVSVILKTPTHAQDLKRLGGRHIVCPHKAALIAAEDAAVIVCDYNYLFSSMRDLALERLNLELGDLVVIIDEAHGLGERIRSEMGRDLILQVFDTALVYARRADTELEAPLRRWRELFRELTAIPGEHALDLHQHLDHLQRVLHADMITPLELKDFRERIELLGESEIEAGADRSGLLELAGFLATAEVFLEEERRAQTPDHLLYAVGSGRDTPARLRLIGLDPWRVGAEVLSRVHGGVLMSGTFSPGEMHARILGVPADRAMIRTYQNPFPVENRPIFLVRGVTTAADRRGPAMYGRIAALIADLVRPSRRSALVFFPSYRFLTEVAGNYPASGKIPELEHRDLGKEDRERIMQRMAEGDIPVFFAVMGGSLSEGVDFPEGTLDLIIIVGVPYLPPTLEIKSWIGYVDREVAPGKGQEYGYLRPTMLKVVQAAGRGIRRATDRCAVVLMDDRYPRKELVAILPSGFAWEEHVQDPRRYEDWFTAG